MKIAVQNPLFLFGDQARNFNGYNFAFFKKYVSSIYITKPWHVFRYQKRMKELGLESEKYEFIYRIKTLNSKIDVLLGFDGEPYHKTRMPPKAFNGRKIWHLMDYVFKAGESARILSDSGVDLAMGYARHDLHCDFFKTHFPSLLGKVISVPFGYGNRFQNSVPFDNRKNVCVAMGAVNPVNDPLCPPGTIDDYIGFYNHKEWTHEFRRTLVANLPYLQHVESFLPLFPETKNAAVDPVEQLNRYKFYVNDEGLLNFPPARTYEGIATGCIMIASRNPIYEELGFIEGENYIAFEKNDLSDFQKQLNTYLQKPEKLLKMHQASLLLAKKFTHEKIADTLYQQILENYSPRKNS